MIPKTRAGSLVEKGGWYIASNAAQLLLLQMILSLLLPLLGSRKNCDSPLSINKIKKTTALGIIYTQNRSNNVWHIEVIHNSKNIVMSHKFPQTLIKIASVCYIKVKEIEEKKHCLTLQHTHQHIAAQGDCIYQVHWPSHSWQYYYNICTHPHQHQRQYHPWSQSMCYHVQALN